MPRTCGFSGTGLISLGSPKRNLLIAPGISVILLIALLAKLGGFGGSGITSFGFR